VQTLPFGDQPDFPWGHSFPMCLDFQISEYRMIKIHETCNIQMSLKPIKLLDDSL
jgi:hypothetical protein